MYSYVHMYCITYVHTVQSYVYYSHSQVCRNSNKAKERMFFLFTDMLIYARPNLGSR